MTDQPAPAKKSPQEETLSIEQAAFDAIERDFHEVMAELSGDRSLEKFRHEYEVLHRALRKSHENERRLIQRVKELGAEIVANASKVKTALQLSQEDQATITSLRRETERMWRLVDTAHERESRAKDTITRLKAEITSLSKLVESSGGVALQEESTVLELLKQKQALRAEADTLKQQVDDLRVQVGELGDRNRALEQDRTVAEDKIAQLRDCAQQLRTDAEREATRKQQLEARAKDLEATVAQLQTELQQASEELEAGEARRVALEHENRELAGRLDTGDKAKFQTDSRLAKLQQELNAQIAQNERLQAQLAEQQTQIRDKEHQVVELDSATRRAQSQLQKLESRLQQTVADRDRLQDEMQQLEQQLLARDTDIALAEREAQAERGRLDQAHREAEGLQRDLRRENAATTAAQKKAGVAEMEAQSLEQEVMAYKSESSKQRRLIHSLELERERASTTAARTAAELQQAREEVRIRELAVADLRQRLQEAEQRLESQQQLYEAVRKDRNTYSRQLAEYEDDVAELRRQNESVQLQLHQAQEEVRAKDEALVREHFERRRTEKSSDGLRAAVDQARQRLAAAEETIAQQQAQIAKMHHVISESKAELQKREQEHSKSLHAHEVVASQLQQCNTKIALYENKIRLLEAQLRHGEAEYMQRVRDVRLLKQHVQELMLQLQLAQKRGAAVLETRHEILRLNKELLEERVKVRALSSELTNPLNVHRWRRLEGADPQTFELLRKTQQLQRRLIAKTEEAAEKDAIIAEKERTYQELKVAMARHPGPEMAEQLAAYQSSLLQKQKQLRAVEAEVTMYQSEVEELRAHIARLEDEIRELKTRYFAATRSRRAQTADQQQPDGRERFQLTEAADAPRIMGGGFNISATARPATGGAPALRPVDDEEMPDLAELATKLEG